MENDELYDLIYILKKLIFYFLLVMIFYFIISYLVIDLLYNTLSSSKIYYYMFPSGIFLYLNVIKSKSYLEFLVGFILLCLSLFISNYFDENMIEYVSLSFFSVQKSKEFSVLFSQVLLANIFILLYFSISLLIKNLISRYAKKTFPEFKTNLKKFLKITFLIFFIAPFSIPGVLLLFIAAIEILTTFSFNFFKIFSKYLIYFQITNIAQLYLNVYRSKNQYEQGIGFLAFCGNLLLSLVYIALTNDEELPEPSIYFNVYYTFFPVLFAIALKYIVNKLTLRNIN